MKHWSRIHLAARAVLLVGPLLALFPAPGATPWWAWTLGIVVGLAGARDPDGYAGLGVILLALFVWAMAPGHDQPVTVLATVALLVIVHVAGVLASYGPPEMDLGRDLLILWARRALALVVGAGVVLGLSKVVDSAGQSAFGWGAGVGAAVLLLLVARASLVGPRST